MREFAENEIVLPDGPFKGRRFQVSRQPYTGPLFDAMSSGLWSMFFIGGPTQSGKTLSSFSVPALYHLFELRETVIIGVPDMDMAADKWRQDLLPVIEQTRYRELLPAKGGGSKGGKVLAIRFEHGVTLRFMTGGGGDKSRAGFTSRVVCISETDGMDQPGGSSRETDKVGQLIARTDAFASRRRVYAECTFSLETGRTQQEWERGTASRLFVPCIHCLEWVQPDREHLHGWQDAETAHEAGDQARFCCPSCGGVYEEQDRRDMVRDCRLVHRGQSIDESGEAQGDPPRTRTLGFRWTGFDNLFKHTRDFGEAEWNGQHAVEADNAEKKLCQFDWGRVFRPETLEASVLTPRSIAQRQRSLPRGIVPADTTLITVGVDLGKWMHNWVATAWLPGATPHIFDYGLLNVPSDQFAEEIAVLTALRAFRDEVLKIGWPRETEPGAEHVLVRPTVTVVDAGNWEDQALAFASETPQCVASKGFGTAQINATSYRAPRTSKSTGSAVAAIGDGYHVARINRNGVERLLLEFDADQWKSFFRARLTTPIGMPGGLTLFQVEHEREHMSFAKQVLAEKPVEEYTPRRGFVTKWKPVDRQNHFLDGNVLACVGGHVAGVRLLGAEGDPSPPRPRASGEKPRSRAGGGSRRSPWVPTSLSEHIR